jgi:ribosomal protein S18 acetylase RimI-like enzyme
MSILNNNHNTKVELIRLNVGLENHIELSGHLFPLPDSDPAQVAHFVIARHSGGCERFFRHDLPVPIREKLTQLDPEQALYDFELVKSILAEDKPCKDAWGGKGYVFSHIPDQSEFPDVLFHEGSLVIMVENEPVAWAWSQEKNEKAAELAVEVLPEYRRRGYGRQLSAAWANHIMHQGLVAFYSHLHDNHPSQALAQSLGVVQYAVSAGYS